MKFYIFTKYNVRAVHLATKMAAFAEEVHFSCSDNNFPYAGIILNDLIFLTLIANLPTN